MSCPPRGLASKNTMKFYSMLFFFDFYFRKCRHRLHATQDTKEKEKYGARLTVYAGEVTARHQGCCLLGWSASTRSTASWQFHLVAQQKGPRMSEPT